MRKGERKTERERERTHQIEDEIANASFDKASLEVGIEHQWDCDETICLRVSRRDEHDVALCRLISQRHGR
jgi:hypothetical protein